MKVRVDLKLFTKQQIETMNVSVIVEVDGSEGDWISRAVGVAKVKCGIYKRDCGLSFGDDFFVKELSDKSYEIGG